MIDRALILMEKYCDADIRSGPTNSESQLVGALASTGLVGQIKRFYFDELCYQLGRWGMATLLLENCEVFRPDLVIYTPIEGTLGERLNPPNEAIHAIRRMGIKVYAHLWDTVGQEEHIKANRLPFVDYIGAVDAFTKPKFGDDPRVIKTYPAIDPKYFHDQKLDRNINVSFVGAMRDHRVNWLNALINNGIDVVVGVGQRQNRLSWEKYAEILCRSKIALNFCVNFYDSRTQTLYQVHKARVWEAMSCGALLVEEDGPETKKLFDQNKDFVTFDFTDFNDWLEKLQYYLEHDAEREQIAHSGHRKAIELYNARNCWGYVFEKMGFEVPVELANDKNFQIHREKMEQ